MLIGDGLMKSGTPQIAILATHGINKIAQTQTHVLKNVLSMELTRTIGKTHMVYKHLEMIFSLDLLLKDNTLKMLVQEPT